MLIVDDDVLRIEWLPTERVIKKTASGFVLSEVLRPAYESVHTFAQHSRATRMLSDNRKAWPAGREDIEWIEQDWLPRMLKAGWRSWAVLEPETSLGAMNVRRLISLHRQHGILAQTFKSEDAALSWLRGQPEP